MADEQPSKEATDTTKAAVEIGESDLDQAAGGLSAGTYGRGTLQAKPTDPADAKNCLNNKHPENM